MTRSSRLGWFWTAAVGACLVCTASAHAADEGEACGRFGLWRARCDSGLRCAIRLEAGRVRLGVCVPEEQVCGGLLGASCPDGRYCDFAPEAQCGAADQTGVCRPIPEVCTQEYLPVCGCDDRTYANACTAHAAGVSVASEGACPTSQRCQYGERTYPAGSTFLAADGCNTCQCDDSGQVSCTERACEPACHVGGCSGELCVGPGEPDISPCTGTDEFACYADAWCERQADGRCGFTQTPRLRMCIEAARSRQGDNP